MSLPCSLVTRQALCKHDMWSCSHVAPCKSHLHYTYYQSGAQVGSMVSNVYIKIGSLTCPMASYRHKHSKTMQLPVHTSSLLCLHVMVLPRPLWPNNPRLISPGYIPDVTPCKTLSVLFPILFYIYIHHTP